MKKNILGVLLFLLFIPMPVIAATLWVDPGELNLDYYQKGHGLNATIAVTNLDMDMDGEFVWTASSDSLWLTVENAGTRNVGSGNVKIALDTTLLDEMSPGSYSGSVAILSDIGKFFVSVSLEVHESASIETRLLVDPNTLYFTYQNGGEGENSTITVANIDANIADFSWTVSSDANWLVLNEPGEMRTGSGSFKVLLDPDILDNMEPAFYTASISIITELGQMYIPVTLNYLPNSENYALNFPTSTWFDTVMEVRASLLESSSLYVLMEHPTLLPGKTYAYRCASVSGDGAETNCDFTLFSENGHLMTNAADLYYDSDAMYNLMTDMVEVPFGGFRLSGLDGQIKIRCMAGTPDPGTLYKMYPIMDLTINIVPLQGQWEVVDSYYGSEFTYEANLFESFGSLEGVWDGITVPYFDYINPSNTMPSNPLIIGSNVYVKDSSLMTGYEVKFSNWNSVLKQSYDYWYQISDLTYFDDGLISGIWRMKESENSEWSVPLNFTATRMDNEFIIPYGMINFRDSYVTTGYITTDSVTKYPVAFLVDTGAEIVLMDEADMDYILNPYTAECVTGQATGASGNVFDITYCSGITLQLTDSIKVENVEIAFAPDQTPALLGMSFLKYFNIRIRSSDNAMIISP